MLHVIIALLQYYDIKAIIKYYTLLVMRECLNSPNLFSKCFYLGLTGASSVYIYVYHIHIRIILIILILKDLISCYLTIDTLVFCYKV